MTRCGCGSVVGRRYGWEDEDRDMGGVGGHDHPDDWSYSRVMTESRDAFGTPIGDKHEMR